MDDRPTLRSYADDVFLELELGDGQVLEVTPRELFAFGERARLRAKRARADQSTGSGGSGSTSSSSSEPAHLRRPSGSP